MRTFFKWLFGIGSVRISKEKLEHYRRADVLFTKCDEAHRWLSEFDWLLKPMWNSFFKNGPDISYVREEMRSELNRFRKDSIPAGHRAMFGTLLDELDKINHRLLVNAQGQDQAAVKEEYWRIRTETLKVTNRLREIAI
jgi:hypothetical protein